MWEMDSYGTKEVEETNVENCIRMIEDFFQKKGLNPDNQRLSIKGTIGWWIERGSALTLIFLNEHDGLHTIRVISPILILPEENLLQFYRRCLEINMHLSNCALGVFKNKVAILCERPIEGLDHEELEGMINSLSKVADDWDNKLADEFGATLYSREDLKGI